MKTITAEEFKRKYGEVGVAQFKTTKSSSFDLLAPAKEALSGLATTYGGGEQGIANKLKTDITQGAKSIQEGDALGSTKAGFRVAGDVASTVYAPVGAALGVTGINKVFDFIGKVSQMGGKYNPLNAITDMKAVQDFVAESPNLEEDFNRALSLTLAKFDSGKIDPKTVIPRTIEQVKAGVGNIKTGASNIVNDVKNSFESSKEKIRPTLNPTETAIKDATPNYETSTPTQKGKLLTRVEEGGILKGRTVKPNKLEIEAGTELSKVPGYDPNATKLAKYQVAKAEAVKRGQGLEESLGNEKVVVPKREVTSRVQKAVNELPNKSLLLQASDPVIKNYMRVFKNAFKDLPGTLKGVLKLKKTLDAAYENARGKQAFGSDKISALDDINKVSRDVLTQYMIEKAVSTKVKASLKSQWDLYRALDELKTAAERESGSILGRFRQNNPILNKAGEAVIKATGFGAGVGIIK